MLLLLTGTLFCLFASAYTCVSFKAGDPSILLKKVPITYEIVWDKARVTNYDNLIFPEYLKKRGDDFVADWPEDRQKAEKYFTVHFNRKSDYMQIGKNNANGEYKMVVNIEKIDVGNGSGAFNPWASSKAGGVIIDGTIDFYDNSGKKVCVLNIVNCKGSSSPSETTRMGLSLMELAADFSDFVEDTVEEGKVQATPINN